MRLVTCSEFWCRTEVLFACSAASVVAPVWVFGVYIPRDGKVPNDNDVEAGFWIGMSLLATAAHVAVFARAATFVEERAWHWRYATTVVAPMWTAALYHVIGFLAAKPVYGFAAVPRLSNVTFVLGIFSVLVCVLAMAAIAITSKCVMRVCVHLFLVADDAPAHVKQMPV